MDDGAGVDSLRELHPEVLRSEDEGLIVRARRGQHNLDEGKTNKHEINGKIFSGGKTRIRGNLMRFRGGRELPEGDGRDIEAGKKHV